MMRVLKWAGLLALCVVCAILWPFVWLGDRARAAWTALDRRRAYRAALPKGTRVRITCPTCLQGPEDIAAKYAGDNGDRDLALDILRKGLVREGLDLVLPPKTDPRKPESGAGHFPLGGTA